MSVVSAVGHIGRTIRGDRRRPDPKWEIILRLPKTVDAAVRRLFTSHALHRNRLRNANA